MTKKISWTVYVPVLAVATLILTWGRDLPPPIVVLVALFLAVFLFLAASP